MSIQDKLDELAAERDMGTIELNEWEDEFLEDMLALMDEKGDDAMTEGRREKIHEVWQKHCG